MCVRHVVKLSPGQRIPPMGVTVRGFKFRARKCFNERSGALGEVSPPLLHPFYFPCQLKHICPSLTTHPTPTPTLPTAGASGQCLPRHHSTDIRCDEERWKQPETLDKRVGVLEVSSTNQRDMLAADSVSYYYRSSVPHLRFLTHLCNKVVFNDLCVVAFRRLIVLLSHSNPWLKKDQMWP